MKKNKLKELDVMTARCFLYPKVWDIHPKAWDVRTKAWNIHPKPWDIKFPVGKKDCHREKKAFPTRLFFTPCNLTAHLLRLTDTNNNKQMNFGLTQISRISRNGRIASLAPASGMYTLGKADKLRALLAMQLIS